MEPDRGVAIGRTERHGDRTERVGRAGKGLGTPNRGDEKREGGDAVNTHGNASTYVREPSSPGSDYPAWVGRTRRREERGATLTPVSSLLRTSRTTDRASTRS